MKAPENFVHRGPWAETVATAYLISEGYQVFRNVEPVGQIDLVAVKNGQAFFFDVKFAPVLDGAPGTRTKLTDAQGDMGVNAIYVDSAGQCLVAGDESVRPAGKYCAVVEDSCEDCGTKIIRALNGAIYCLPCRSREWRAVA